MTVVIGNPEHGHAVADAAGVIFNPAVDIIFSRELKGELAGGIMLNGYSPGGSISMHTAGFTPFWVSKTILACAFGYCFQQLKVKKVFGQVASKNTRSLEINRRLGFIVETVIADVFADDDLVLMSVRREACPWADKTFSTLEQIVHHGRQVESSSSPRLYPDCSGECRGGADLCAGVPRATPVRSRALRQRPRDRAEGN